MIGGSATMAVDVLKSRGVPEDRILFVNLIASPEGINVFAKKFPKLRVVTAFIDQVCNPRESKHSTFANRGVCSGIGREEVSLSSHIRYAFDRVLTIVAILSPAWEISGIGSIRFNVADEHRRRTALLVTERGQSQIPADGENIYINCQRKASARDCTAINSL